MLKIATFHTTTGAMKFERLLKSIDEVHELKPVPRSISAGCGICVEFTWEPDSWQSITDLDRIFIKNGSTLIEL